MKNKMTQIKFTIDSGVVSAFKAKCVSEGVSMASVISEWMSARSPTNKVKIISTFTRPERQKAVSYYIDKLSEILDAESAYRDNIPEQFEQRIETANHSCEQLEEAIASLEDAF